MHSSRIRAGRGLGDAIYLQSIVKHLVEKGKKLEVLTDWPDVFSNVDTIKISPFTRENVDIVAHYTLRKKEETKQFKDMCIQAGIEDYVELELKHNPLIDKFTEEMFFVKNNKPKLAVLIYRSPMGRDDGFAFELLPKIEVMNRAIINLSKYYQIVFVGKGKHIEEYNKPNDCLDFMNMTTVSELINIVSKCDAVFSYCSFMIPLAESLGKDGLYCWSTKGLDSQKEYIRLITPEKILYKNNSSFFLDNIKNNEIERVIDEFINER